MPSMPTGAATRRIGEYLPVSPAAIEWAVSVQGAELAAGNVRPVGEILIERELVTREDLLSALERQRIDRLRHCPLCAALPDADLARIGEHAEEIPLAAGQELLRQGHCGDSIYALLSGRLLIYRRLRHHEGVAEGVAVPGDYLGDAEYFSDGTHSISACAVEPALVLRIRYEFLRECAGLSRDQAASVNADFLSLQAPGPSAAPGSRMPENVTEHIVRRACQALEVDRADLFRLDRETGEFLTRVTAGEECRTFRVRPGSGIVGYVARTGELVNLAEAYLDDRFDPEIDVFTGYWTRTLLAGPVRNPRGDVIADLQAANRKKGLFAQEDEVLFRAFAHQAAAALSRIPRS